MGVWASAGCTRPSGLPTVGAAHGAVDVEEVSAAGVDAGSTDRTGGRPSMADMFDIVCHLGGPQLCP